MMNKFFHFTDTSLIGKVCMHNDQHICNCFIINYIAAAVVAGILGFLFILASIYGIAVTVIICMKNNGKIKHEYVNIIIHA